MAEDLDAGTAARKADVKADLQAELKAEVKRLNARATQAKMDLHDLSEELPTDWQRIPEVARLAHEAHAALVAARERLAELSA